MENILKYALAVKTEHRANVFLEHKIQILLEYALATTNLLSENRSDGEVKTIPNTLKEAMETPQAAKWKEVADREMESLGNHKVFDLVSSVSVPSEKKVIGTKWVFKVKADHTLKGRVVVQGWRQVPGIDCRWTYAPVCRIQSIWMAVAIAVHENWEVLQLDVQTACHNASVQEEVYVKTPPGYGRRYNWTPSSNETLKQFLRTPSESLQLVQHHKRLV